MRKRVKERAGTAAAEDGQLAGCRVNDGKAGVPGRKNAREIDGLDLGALKEFSAAERRGGAEAGRIGRPMLERRRSCPAAGRTGRRSSGAAGERRCSSGPSRQQRRAHLVVFRRGAKPGGGYDGAVRSGRPCAWGWPSSCGPRPASTAAFGLCGKTITALRRRPAAGRCCLRWGAGVPVEEQASQQTG